MPYPVSNQNNLHRSPAGRPRIDLATLRTSKLMPKVESARPGANIKTRDTVADPLIGQGQRNKTLLQLASDWSANGLDQAAIYEKLTKANMARCSPPLSDRKLKRIAANAFPAPVEVENGDLPTLVAVATLDRYFKGGKHLLAHDGCFFRYAETEWVPMTDDQLKKVVLQTLDETAKGKAVRTAAVMNEVITILRAKQAAGNDPFYETTAPPAIINCTNRELHLHSSGKVRLHRHSPKSGLRHTLPVNYDENAKCPEYDRALSQIFSNAKKPKELIRHWNELVGYLIQPTRHHPAIVAMLGAGGNGKTKLVATIMKLLGPDAVHGGRVEELASNRFAIGSLRGKLLFVDDDVDTDIRLPDGILKTLSEGKRVTGEAKYKNAFSFDVRAVPMLLCNNVPLLQDTSHGMLRRLHVLPFDKVFKGKEKDEALFPRIWANELSGVLNRALEGWKRLQERGHFDLPSDATRAANRWVKEASPFTAFIHEACERTPSARAPVKKVFQAFVDWAKASSIKRSVTRLKFKHDLEHAGFEVKKSNGDIVVYGLDLQ